jgi:uncharacterized protein (TIGR03000 family)
MGPTQGSGTYIGGYPGASLSGYSAEPRLFTNPGYKGYTTPIPPRYEDYYPHYEPRVRRPTYVSPEEMTSRPLVRGARSAGIWVTVPANAEIWFDGQRTFQRGSLREFESPPLGPGKEYIYRLRARWTEDGKTMDETRDVTVQSGKYVRVKFGETK